MKIKTDDGVSPVVAVMLMLAVTVIIAAIVSAAAGGLSGTKKQAPSAILEVHFYENRSYGTDFYINAMTIEHVSGSPLQTKDLSISTYFRNSTGELIKGSLMGEKSIEFSSGDYSGKSCGVLFINDQDRFPDSPLVNSADGGYKSWFGNASAVLMAGDYLVTPAPYYATSTEKENSALDSILNFKTYDHTGQIDNGYKTGSVITVKIVHIPTGQVIFDKDVVII
ncbi:MAG: type IV pilin N-terminal domain-containing protein [Methanoregula sp.]|jgi:FlaG/FlaF family flagellin (archaellin)|uniref:type IV pilin N-terminal domain-containing protein n=1 Tax=Methanoregula sp. TaxID=2052170 RepID=UPI0025FAAFBA|nr:type IV pilin N-terminal domain-containing protein [Methanoregula sp.]MCK9630628.1 type IV pilin N-terminal domain-containing protein [Methanoregula sp.]